MPLPTMHRHAPLRVTAIDSVQHKPLRTSLLGTVGVNRITLVSDTVKGLTGTCACTEVAQNSNTKLARNALRLIALMATAAASWEKVACPNALPMWRPQPG